MAVGAPPVSGGAKGQQVDKVASVGLWTVTRAVPKEGEMNGTWFGHDWKRTKELACRVARRWPDLQPRAGDAHLHVVLAGVTLGSSMEMSEGVPPSVLHGPVVTATELGSQTEGDGWGGEDSVGEFSWQLTRHLRAADASSSGGHLSTRSRNGHG